MPEFAAPGLDRFDEEPEELDPDLGAVEVTVEAPSQLDDVRAELTAQVAEPTVIPVPSRAGYAVEFRTDFTQLDLEGLRKQAKSRRFAGGIDATKFNALLLAFACRRILRHGHPLDLGDGPVTFTSRAFQELYRADRAITTVLAFYGLEGHIDSTANRLIAEAGWGENIEAVTGDPQ